MRRHFAPSFLVALMVACVPQDEPGQPDSDVVADADVDADEGLDRPDGSIVYGPTALSCGLAGSPQTDIYGLCSFAFGTALSPQGTWSGTVDDGSGAIGTATLLVE